MSVAGPGQPDFPARSFVIEAKVLFATEDYRIQAAFRNGGGLDPIGRR